MSVAFFIFSIQGGAVIDERAWGRGVIHGRAEIQAGGLNPFFAACTDATSLAAMIKMTIKSTPTWPRTGSIVLEAKLSNRLCISTINSPLAGFGHRSHSRITSARQRSGTGSLQLRLQQTLQRINCIAEIIATRRLAMGRILLLKYIQLVTSQHQFFRFVVTLMRCRTWNMGRAYVLRR